MHARLYIFFHRYILPYTINSFYVVWNTHGAVNKHALIYGHMCKLCLSVLTSSVQT